MANISGPQPDIKYCASLWQDSRLGVSLPDSHRPTVVWLTFNSLASSVGRWPCLFINCWRNFRKRSDFALMLH